MPPTILVVDADKSVRALVKKILNGLDFFIHEAVTCKRMIEIVSQNDLDLIALDPALPDGSGLDCIKHLRQITHASIILCANSYSIEQKEDLSDQGVDYFIEKPINPREMLMRIKAEIRRYRILGVRKSPSSCLPVKIKFGRWFLDRDRFQIYDEENRNAALTFQEYQLLEKLAMASNRVLSREELIHALKDDQPGLCHRAIDVKITRIRKKIGDSAESAEIIKTVRGAGYMLACDTEIIET